MDLLNDLRQQREVHGDATAVLVTGDISFSARKEEFEAARSWLDEVADAVGVERSQILTVPGNHDVDWTEIGQASSDSRRNLRECGEDEITALLDSYLSDPAQTLFTPLRNYNDFAVSYGCQVRADGEPWQVRHKLSSGYELAICGLTTVWNSDSGDRKGTLVVGASQMTLKQDSPGRLYLLLGHHGPEECRDSSMIRDRGNGRAYAYLSGHRHDQRVSRHENWLELVAGAVNPQDGHGWNAVYNWVRLDVDADDKNRPQLVLSVHPRIFRPELNAFSADFLDSHDSRTEYFKLPILANDVQISEESTQAQSIGAVPNETRPPETESHVNQQDAQHVASTFDDDIDLRFPLEDEEGRVNSERRLIRDLLDLTYSQQMRVFAKCDLLTQADRDKGYAQMLSDVVTAAGKAGLLEELEDAVREEQDRSEGN